MNIGCFFFILFFCCVFCFSVGCVFFNCRTDGVLAVWGGAQAEGARSTTYARPVTTVVGWLVKGQLVVVLPVRCLVA